MIDVERPLNEREATARDIASLAAELESRDSAVAVLLRRFSDAVRLGKHEETRAYATAVDPRALAELLVDRRSTFWAIFEGARNGMVFASIAVTWDALSGGRPCDATLLEL